MYFAEPVKDYLQKQLTDKPDDMPNHIVNTNWSYIAAGFFNDDDMMFEKTIEGKQFSLGQESLVEHRPQSFSTWT